MPASEMNEYLRFGLLIVILLFVLGSFILYLSWPLLTGKTIVLATQPVDPFDPLRGQYIIIRYEISTISAPTDAKEGNTVYVSLTKDAEGISRYASASLSPPRDIIFIKGKIKNIYGSEASVEYGIEQYFFERNAEFQTQGIQVEAKVASDGQARITQLLRDGKPVEIKYQEKSFLR